MTVSELAAKTPRASSLRHILLGLFGVVAAVLFLVFLALPGIIEGRLVDFVQTQVGITPTIERVRFDPIHARLTVEGFKLQAPTDPQPILTFDELAVDLRLSGFLTADLVLDEAVLRAPRIVAEVDESGEFNIARLVAEASSNRSEDEMGPSDPQEVERLLIIDVEAIRIEKGDLLFRDRAQTPTFETRVVPFDLQLTGFTTRPGVSAPLELSLRVDESTQLDWRGTLGLDPLQSEGQIEVRDFDLRTAWAYLSDALQFEVGAGSIDLSTAYRVDFEDSLKVSIHDASLELENLALTDRLDASDVMSLPRLAIRGIEARVTEARLVELVMEEVEIQSGRTRTRLDPGDRLRLVEVLAPKPDEPGALEEPAGEVEPVVATQTVEDDHPIQIRVERIKVSDFQVDLVDRRPSRPVELRFSGLHLDIEDYDNTPNHSFDFSFESDLNEKGHLELEGPISLDPLKGQMKLRGDGISLGEFQPYLESFAQFELKGGSLSAALAVSILEQPDADAGPSVAATGRVQIDDLIAIDRQRSERFLEWGSLRIEGLDYSPGGLDVLEIGLSQSSVNVVLASDGRSNLGSVLVPAVEAPEATPPASAAGGEVAGDRLAIRIDRVKLDTFDLAFRDLSIEPEFELKVDGLSGTIEGLSSDEGARAQVDLAGRVNENASITISGQINPLTADAFTDLEATIVGLSMPRFGPYSGKFVGYTIERGKVDLDLIYRLGGRTLEAQNHISLSGFDFGQKVEGDDATSLPVPLAVALMRDGSGQITIDLPIRGDLDDPDFSVLGLIGKAFVNLITRVATTPFAMVGDLVGGSSEEFASVAFAPGSDRLSPAASRELGTLATAISGRPALRLAIRGRADPEVDGPALRASRIEAELRRAAFEALSLEERERLGSAEAFVLEPALRRAELEKLYASRVGGRGEELVASVTVGGSEKEANEAEARAREIAEAVFSSLAAQVELAESDWQSLARARAESVQSTLVRSSEIEPERAVLADVEVGAVSSDGAVSTELILVAD